jgi:hypothetical protein
VSWRHPQLEAEHFRRWLAPYAVFLDEELEPTFRQWIGRLTSDEPDQIESAVAEAVAWDWLRCRVDAVQVVPTDGAPAPDFHCRVGSREFFVEVRNVAISTMTKWCGLPHGDRLDGCRWLPIPARQLHQAILGKAKQGAELKAPYLVMLTTLHDHGSRRLLDKFIVESLLTSRPMLAARVHVGESQMVEPVHSIVDFEHSVVTRSGSTNVARTMISGALLAPFGLLPAPATVRRPFLGICGILHPSPQHPFDPRILDDVAFCRFRHWPPGRSASLMWVQGDRELELGS